MDMRTRDREYLNAQAGRRLESMLRRFGDYAVKVQALGVMVPYMPPWETYAGMGRTIERLRDGKVQHLPSRIPRLGLSDLTQLAFEKETVGRSVVAQLDEHRPMEWRINARLDVERC